MAKDDRPRDYKGRLIPRKVQLAIEKERKSAFLRFAQLLDRMQQPFIATLMKYAPQEKEVYDDIAALSKAINDVVGKWLRRSK